MSHTRASGVITLLEFDACDSVRCKHAFRISAASTVLDQLHSNVMMLQSRCFAKIPSPEPFLNRSLRQWCSATAWIMWRRSPDKSERFLTLHSLQRLYGEYGCPALWEVLRIQKTLAGLSANMKEDLAHKVTWWRREPTAVPFMCYLIEQISLSLLYCGKNY